MPKGFELQQPEKTLTVVAKVEMKKFSTKPTRSHKPIDLHLILRWAYVVLTCAILSWLRLSSFPDGLVRTGAVVVDVSAFEKCCLISVLWCNVRPARSQLGSIIFIVRC